jgi:integrase
LTDEAIEILRRQKMKNAMCKVLPIEWKDYIFLCRKGTPVKNSTYDTMFQKMCDRICIPRFSMHVLRHTFATRCIEAGFDAKSLSEILGHASVSTTMALYVHPSLESKRTQLAKLMPDPGNQSQSDSQSEF